MIINLWSTPRTGSVWYSHWLAQHTNSLLITEMFNRFHMNMYHVRGEDGVIKNFHHPVEGGFYKEFYLDEHENIVKRNVHGIRTRTPDQEEEYCVDILRRGNRQQNLVLHNHIDPINIGIRDWLIEIADRNIWIYRRDRRRQLASYAVALSTKKFAAFKPQVEDNSVVEDCDIGPLQNLIRRIGVWDSFDSKSEIVAFEDINFYNQEGFPWDQNTDPWSRLSPTLQEYINNLVTEYENNTDTRG